MADLETDGQLEVVAGRGSSGTAPQLNVYEPNGTVRRGLARAARGRAGLRLGMLNANVTVADMNGSGLKEILGPTDTHYITGLDRNGNQLPTSASTTTSTRRVRRSGGRSGSTWTTRSTCAATRTAVWSTDPTSPIRRR